MKLASFERSLKRALKAQSSPWKYFDSEKKIDAKALHKLLSDPEEVPELMRELEKIVYGYNRSY